MLVGLVLAATFGPAAASASAEVLVDQPPGPSGIAVPSDSGPEPSEAYDDFAVPLGTHWQLSGIRVFGTAAVERPRTFNVKIYWGGDRDDRPILVEPEEVFKEQVSVPGGPDYLIPIEGAPSLEADNISLIPGYYWITVQAVSTGGEEEWSWLTGPDTPGSAPAYPRASREPPAGAEPGLAFELLGTEEQILRVQVVNNYAGSAAIVSNPPGISCLSFCEGAFPRGTTVTLSASPLQPSVKFTQWGFLNVGYVESPGPLVSGQVPTPCAGTSATCTFTLTRDEQVEANFEPIDEVDVLHVILDRRHGRGELVVWVPGEGVLSTFSEGVRNQGAETVPAGVARIPLTPRTPVTRRLRRKGSAKVAVAVTFRPTKSVHSGTVRLHPTLVLKPPRRPGRAVH